MMGMKKLFLILFLFLLWSTTYAQLKLPELSTTEKQASNDLVEGNANEEWFSSKDKFGNLVYKLIFKNTPVSFKHALVAFDQVKSDYRAESCKDESMYSNVTMNRDNSINYEMLSFKIKTEGAEIDKSCTIKDDLVVGFNLKSMITNNISFLVLIITTNKKV